MSQYYAGAARPSVLRNATLVVAAAFGLVGVLGFVPGVTTDYDQLELAGHDSGAQLLGLFGVSVLHNLVHLAFAVAGFVLARTDRGARAFLVGGGIVYLVLTGYGLLVDRHDTANFVPLDEADNWLHLGLGLGMIALALVIGARDRIEPAASPGDTSVPRRTAQDQSRLADEMSEGSFPTSDPPSTWAGPDGTGQQS